MKRACIAIVDAARARIYTYDQTTDGGRSAPAGALHEKIDLVNPGRRGHDARRRLASSAIRRAIRSSGSAGGWMSAPAMRPSRRPMLSSMAETGSAAARAASACDTGADHCVEDGQEVGRPHRGEGGIQIHV